MCLLRLWLIVSIMLATPALAQSTIQRGAITPQSQRTVGGSRTPVATTQPSKNPFQNPIGQGVPPAANSNSNGNGNLISVPPNR
jgi:hypothetical protein